MNAGNDDIQFREEGLVEIEPAIAQDIDLTAGQKTEVAAAFRKTFIKQFDFAKLFAEAFGLKAASLDR